jgi:hypothetical protein
MKPFTGSNKIYAVSLPRRAGELLESADRSASTAVFFQGGPAGEDGMALMLKILSAAKVTEHDRILIDKTEHPAIRIRMLINSLHSLKFVLLFGVDPSSAGLNIALAPYTLSDAGPYRILFSDPPETLLQNEALKRRLWNSLREMYAL